MAPDSASGVANRGQGEVVVPHSDVPDGAGLTIHVRVALDGAYPPAQKVFAQAVQKYAENLADESARQEITSRAPGAKTVEITESAVIRAEETLERESAKRQRPANALEALSLAGAPMFSGATGVMGSYLHSPVQVIAFGILAASTVSCILYSLKRRLL